MYLYKLLTNINFGSICVAKVWEIYGKFISWLIGISKYLFDFLQLRWLNVLMLKKIDKIFCEGENFAR